MRNPVSAFEVNPALADFGTSEKARLKSIMEAVAPVMSKDPLRCSNNLDLPQKPSQLNIAIVGAGVAGSAALQALSRDGHNVLLLEQREQATRENLVTVNANSRQLLNKWSSNQVNSRDQFWQTDGSLGFSERVPLRQIESVMQRQAHLNLQKHQSVESLRGIESIAIDGSSELVKPSITFTFNGQTNTRHDLDLIVLATGAGSASPYNDRSTLAKDFFEFEPILENGSGVVYAKQRFHLEPGEQPPCHEEIEVTLPGLGRIAESANFVNVYTGRVERDEGGSAAYDTALIASCRAQDGQGARSSATEPQLQRWLDTVHAHLAIHDHPEVQRFARAQTGLEPSARQVQFGTANVSLWVTKSAVSKRLSRVVAIGNLIAPRHPWTGSGANGAIAAAESVRSLASGIADLKISHYGASLRSSCAQHRLSELLNQFEHQLQPMRLEACMYGVFATTMFERAQDQFDGITREASQ